MAAQPTRVGKTRPGRTARRPLPWTAPAAPAPTNEAVSTRFALAVIFVVALLIWLPDLWRPVDGTVRDSWREVDVAAIARNFQREGMNLFYPRIDWRGDGPGYVEAEFPLYPWTAAALYRVFGYREQILRVISLALSLASLAVFMRLAQRLLSPTSAVIAATLYALAPLTARMATTIHPEPLMFFAYLLALDTFDRWLAGGRRRDYGLALAATTLAILAKLPAAHVGVLFACLSLDRLGWQALRRIDVWLFALAALAVPAAWYAHAHGLWLTYGNSLGISNESLARMSSFDFSRHLQNTVPGLIRIEARHVWMPTGALLGVWGLWQSLRQPKLRMLAYWTLTLAVYYFITGRTTGELWAVHYHIVSLPLAALLIAAGCQSLEQLRVDAQRWRRWPRVAAAWGAATLVVALASSQTSGLSWLPTALAIAGAAGLLAAAAMWVLPPAGALATAEGARTTGGKFATSAAAALVALLAATVATALYFDYEQWRPAEYQGKYHAALEFRTRMTPDALIVASGGPAFDPYGMPHAYNAPYYFFWTDHRGFTIADEDQNVDKLEQLRGRGARYYIAERDSLAARPQFLDELRGRYAVLVERDEAVLIDLTPATQAPAG